MRRKSCYESRKALLEQGALPRRQVDEANVAYVQARSQYEVAAKHLDSLEKVGKDAETKQAQAQLEAAKARNQGAEVQLEYSRILSPIDGVITDRPLYAGEMTGPGTPLLTVMDISRVVARANVPAEQLAFLKVGNPATITAVDSSAELHGKVTVVSPALDPNSTTAEVWVEAQNPGEQFKPGSSVQVSILAETAEDAIVIPLAAILPTEEGGSIVLVVGSDSLAHERKIEIGIRETDRVQVLKGLEPGEQVIVVGGLGLEDGARVRIEATDEKPSKQPDEKTSEKLRMMENRRNQATSRGPRKDRALDRPPFEADHFPDPHLRRGRHLPRVHNSGGGFPVDGLPARCHRRRQWRRAHRPDARDRDAPDRRGGQRSPGARGRSIDYQPRNGRSEPVLLLASGHVPDAQPGECGAG